MHGSLLNLLFTAVFLFAVTACFWASERVEDVSPPESEQSPIQDLPSSNKTAPGKNKDVGDFIVQHLDVVTAKYNDIDRQVRADRLLENAAEKLNRALILTDDIYLRTRDCGQINAFYDTTDHSVTMCYELMEHFYGIFKSSGESDQKAFAKMSDAVRFVFLHEIAHALIDQYKLPIGGNEEDAADRCSAYINLKELGEDGVRAVYAAADAFHIESKQNAGSARNLADEHLLQEQRFYNSLCMIYGSNPVKYSNVVTDGYLPRDRAAKCEAEYKRTVDSWVRLLGPWRKRTF